MKVVINDKFGGFGLSHKAVMRYAEIKGITLYPYVDEMTKKVWRQFVRDTEPTVENLLKDGGRVLKPSYTTDLEDKEKGDFYPPDIPRDDPVLIQVIEEMGGAADGNFAALKIVEIPDDVEWQIEEYDGNEWVAEKHRTWR